MIVSIGFQSRLIKVDQASRVSLPRFDGHGVKTVESQKDEQLRNPASGFCLLNSAFCIPNSVFCLPPPNSASSICFREPLKVVSNRVERATPRLRCLRSIMIRSFGLRKFNGAVLGLSALSAGLLLLGGCGKRESLVEIGDRTQEYRVGNSDEPSDLDPQIAIGELEHYIMVSLFEGLVVGDPKDVSPRPGVAERWDISPDGKTYTFQLRHNARWSNGDPVTARDFLESYRRMLTPSLGAQYSYMLYPVTNAEAFNTGKLTDFDQVGFKALDDFTFEVKLHSPTPYLLRMMIHDSWFPVPISTIKKCGAIDDRSNPWTRPEHFVGDGPFTLKEWRLHSHVLVEKSSNYWDAANVRLNKIYFDPEESYDTEERMFRSGQLHTIREAPLSKVAFYLKYKPNLIRIYPEAATEFYKFNVTRPPFNDKRVRQALAMAIDRRAITTMVTRAGEIPAFCLTPPDVAGYTAAAHVREDIPAARRLLAEAGYPDGKDFPRVELLYNTLERNKAIAEALQQMWKINLNVDIVLHNEEWKVFLDTQRRTDYALSRAGWSADYLDPSTFMDIFITDGGNNQTGWSSAEYDRLCAVAAGTGDQAARFAAFQKAEAILMDEMPILPIFYYTRPRLIRPSVKGWYPNLLDQPNYKSIYLDPKAE
jgi:oligopeptide transport system substrate-binding protein